MIREETVFGPIHSRRLGSSLGINLLPEKGKICTFDCIYCECGWNKDGRNDTLLPSAEKVRKTLEIKLQQCKREGVPIDSITFSGDGESTINPEFSQIIDDTIVLRDKYYPNSKITVLSNATMVHKPEVFAALRKVDNPVMKIDAPTNALIEKINHPAPGYDIHRVVEALKQFGWMDIVRILRPRETMVYTIDRPTPEEGLQKFTIEEMRALVQPLIDEGFVIQIKG